MSEDPQVLRRSTLIIEPPKTPRPRWMLRIQANFWRSLMSIGMFIHKLAPPRPPSPDFYRVIPTAISPTKGTVKIHFYVPPAWHKREKQQLFPVVVNFHGGGFTIGTATDDARWAHALVDQVGAIVASVDYRLAPEHPFPTAVEDGVDAVMYVARHAEELGIDKDRIAVSGFSSGGNMAFTVPLRLKEELEPAFTLGDEDDMTTTTEVHPTKGGGTTTTTEISEIQSVTIAAIVSWYPSTDYTRTRAQRRATNVRKDQELSAVFTELFDESYLPSTLNKDNPYLSPSVADNNILSHGLPQNIILYTCEYDMLLAEAKDFKVRLEHLGKQVKYHMVDGVPHGWDKAPNPISMTPKVKEHYEEACRELKRAFAGKPLESVKSTENLDVPIESHGAVLGAATSATDSNASVNDTGATNVRDRNHPHSHSMDITAMSP